MATTSHSPGRTGFGKTDGETAKIRLYHNDGEYAVRSEPDRNATWSFGVGDEGVAHLPGTTATVEVTRAAVPE
jgi:hypothetical protein